MSQKINPISFRLGLFQVWNTVLSSYNNCLNFYYLNKNLNLEKYTKYLLENSKCFIGSTSWFLNNKKIVLILTCINFSSTLNCMDYFKNKLKFFLKQQFKTDLKIYLIKYASWFDSSVFLSFYIYQSILKGNSFQQTLKNSSKLVSNKLNAKKVVYTTKGPIILKLKGLKIKSSGRFDNSRTKMSSLLHYKIGSLPSLKLNNYVEYTYKRIYTKSGVCSLHVWLIFSL